MTVETIFALASGAGRAAVAVIRLSGPAAGATLSALAGATPEPRRADYVRFRDPRSDETLDYGLALWFPAPHSATGEDCAELHLHGGRAVVDAALLTLAQFPGLRLAEPGEFARRAFVNGKIDLSQAEALADLIEARTAFQRRQALRLAGGALRRETEIWRSAIVEAMALVESDLDFADEAEVSAVPAGALESLLGPALEQIDRALASAPASERLREGFLVVLLGPPNAGKSTLLNALARREAAIVSEEPGTTRDLIEVELDLGGLPITLVDTAGLRESESAVERIGVARARARAGEADLILWLSEGGAEPAPDFGPAAAEVLRVATKADVVQPAPDSLAVSTREGRGMDILCNEIAYRAGAALGDGGSALIAHARQRAELEEARERLGAALQGDKAPELVAEDLRLAARALQRIAGAVDVEDLLGLIFSRFCIGK
ncbi:tRNA uridine-5-carboxymethylaminomethyl(34) synthesis GTPase MnmE [Methylocystis bryophila]|uniref:tRNA modification GTPase MnmE n=1 Tax=Methylocystis bryophila TaxID=655015 RepID=A0A1W6MUR4_9HYPH|nr:tRNA uridine-5-carboxymethylaminomethyl(34) synthesis GTPase MnmE [Methylocystis bryophila]ARN81322.1 tRNA uridine-5-carboxymethylaminomethyl(34) synthesis GTPase MnmE [Methylocystis bryophila]BDV37297.1 tRNA modification GTPase MnmE [Methylocystis bryophila]